MINDSVNSESKHQTTYNFIIDRLTLLIKVSRPISWAFWPVILLLGASQAGIPNTFLFYFMLVAFTVPYNIVLYGINDIYDYESDQLNPRKNLVQGIKLAKKDQPFVLKTAVFISIGLIITSLFTQNIVIIGLVILQLFISWAYSMPPLRLKTKPPLDSLVNSIGYFTIPFIIGYSFLGNYQNFPFNNLVACSVFMLGLHAFSTIFDYEADNKAGDRTFAVKFGIVRAAAFASASSFVSLLVVEFTFLKIFFLFTTILFGSVIFQRKPKLAKQIATYVIFGGLIMSTFWLLNFYLKLV